MRKKHDESLHLVYAVVVQGAGQGVTRAEIARVLGWKKTPWLIQLLNELVSMGYIASVWDDSGYPPGWRYYPADREAVVHDIPDWALSMINGWSGEMQ